MEIGLFDSNFFHQASLTLGGENYQELPKSITWVRNTYLPITIFTDIRLGEVEQSSADINGALLVEPPAISGNHYDYVFSNIHKFDFVLSYDYEFVDYYYKRMGNFFWYPLGGSWIPLENFGIHEKNKNISLITSAKYRAPGHKMRHEIAKMKPYYDIDIYGKPYGFYFASKTLALSEYRYSIIVENSKITGYFTEKLIDCLSQGTIPIYWGCPISSYFDINGFIIVDTLDDIKDAIQMATPELYERILSSGAIETNLEICKEYRCAEDNIYNMYKETIFGQ